MRPQLLKKLHKLIQDHDKRSDKRKEKMRKRKATVVSVIRTLGQWPPNCESCSSRFHHPGSLSWRAESKDQLRYCTGPSNSKAFQPTPLYRKYRDRERPQLIISHSSSVSQTVGTGSWPVGCEWPGRKIMHSKCWINSHGRTRKH